MNVRDIIKELEKIAPVRLAAEWDNVGLLVGDKSARARRLLLCIDLTQAVLAEAVHTKAQMVMAYHPVIFKAITRLTAEATPIAHAAARKGIAVYSLHTALDAAPGGTNDVLAEAVGLVGARPMEPAKDLDQCKIVVFVPTTDLINVAQAAFAAGAGQVGDYHDCSFFTHGIGTFMGGPETHPAIGLQGQHEAVEEVRLEVVAPLARSAEVVTAIRAAHSYEVPAVDVYRLEKVPDACGLGRIGRLRLPETEGALIERIKEVLGVKRLWIARPDGRDEGAEVNVAACSAGSSGGLYRSAAAGGATFYLTGEMRHHDALAATAAGLTVVCAGHSNSERPVLSRLADRLAKALPKLQIDGAGADADPFSVI